MQRPDHVRLREPVLTLLNALERLLTSASCARDCGGNGGSVSPYHSQPPEHDGEDGTPFGTAKKLKVPARVQVVGLKTGGAIGVIGVIGATRMHYLAQNGERRNTSGATSVEA